MNASLIFVLLVHMLEVRYVIQTHDFSKRKVVSKDSVLRNRSINSIRTSPLDNATLSLEDKPTAESSVSSWKEHFINKPKFPGTNKEESSPRNVRDKERLSRYLGYGISVPGKTEILTWRMIVSPDRARRRSRWSGVFETRGYQIHRKQRRVVSSSVFDGKKPRFPREIFHFYHQEPSKEKGVISHYEDQNDVFQTSRVVSLRSASLSDNKDDVKRSRAAASVLNLKRRNQSNPEYSLATRKRLRVTPLVDTLQGYIKRNECLGIKWCDCEGRKIYCDGGGTSLPYVPKLPTYTSEFYFYDNYLPKMTASTFSNLTDVPLRVLTIGNNSLQACDANVFQGLMSLHTLIIESETRISASAFRQCLIGVNETRLKHLQLADVTLDDIPADFFSGLANSSVKAIEIFSANFDEFDLRSLAPLPGLHTLKLINCGLRNIKLHRFKHLHTLNLKHNYLSVFPEVCRNGLPLFPILRSFALSSNSISRILPEDISCLKNLEVLSFQYNPIAGLLDNMFSGFAKLRQLEISVLENRALAIGPLAFNSSSLTYLDIRGPQVVDWYAISKDIFSYCPNLRYLFVDMNSLGVLTEGDFFRFFSPLTELRNLSMSSTSLSFLPTVISTHLLKLEYLSFEDNRVTSWPSDYFRSLTKLKYLSLASNKITTLNNQSVAPLLELRGIVFLGINPYDCSCDLLWFIKQLKHRRVHLVDYPVSYRCFSPLVFQNQRFDEVALTDRYCLLTTRIAVTIVIVLSILLIVVVVGSISYRFRWYAKYVAYMVHFDRRRRERLNANRNAYAFDVYLSCSDDDFDFILWRILPVFEDELGLKVYAPHRDGIGCKMDGIVTNMDQSRKIVTFLSASYARDHFCEFEARQAYQRGLMEKTNSMVVVLLEELAVMDLSQTLYNIVKTGGYVSWSCLPEGERLSWIKLKDLMMDMDDLRP